MSNPVIAKAAFADGDLWAMVPLANTKQELTDGLKALGYDGVIVDGGRTGILYVNEAVVFSPNQIKSADGNSGDFNLASCNIFDNISPIECLLGDDDIETESNFFSLS